MRRPLVAPRNDLAQHWRILVELKSEWVVLREFEQSWEAQLACGALESAGIPAKVDDTAYYEALPERGHRMLVHRASVDAALSVLDAPADEGEGITRIRPERRLGRPTNDPGFSSLLVLAGATIIGLWIGETLFSQLNGLPRAAWRFPGWTRPWPHSALCG